MDGLQSDLSHHHRVEYASPTFGQPSTAAVADVCSSPSFQEFRNSLQTFCPKLASHATFERDYALLLAAALPAPAAAPLPCLAPVKTSLH